MQVGRALGPSILDLTGSNPLSRIQNSEFRSIHGLRRALLTEIERTSKSASVFSSASNNPNKVTITSRSFEMLISSVHVFTFGFRLCVFLFRISSNESNDLLGVVLLFSIICFQSSLVSAGLSTGRKKRRLVVRHVRKLKVMHI